MLVAGTPSSPNSALTINGGTVDATGYPQTVSSLTVGALGTLDLSVGNPLTSTNAASFNGALNVSNLAGVGQARRPY